jgi:CubicO group peptidase (beta-lactamase class C family)
MKLEKLDSFVFDKMSSSRLPGVSLALVKRGRVVYARGFGLSDIERGTPASAETIYGAASITKSFVAIGILQLAEKKRLRLSDPVERFVRWPGSGPRGQVRLHHLLSHTSGMPALAYIEAVLRHAYGIGGRHLAIGKPRDVLTFMSGAGDWSECPPGQRWFYLNEGYVALGEIIEQVSGQRLDPYIREHILDPLGMSSSFFLDKDMPAGAQVGTPYVLPAGAAARAGRYLHGVLGGDAGLLTNVLDLARYAGMLLDGGRGVLTPRSFEQLTRPRIAMPGDPLPELLGGERGAASPARYAYGLTVTDDFLGQRLIGHSGSLIVATGYVGVLPERGLGVAVLANGNGYAMAQLGKVALAMMLGREPEALPFVRLDRVLRDLTGFYETFRGTLRVKVAREGDFLRIEFQCPDQCPGAVTLVPERLDGPEPRFFTYADGARLDVQFRRTGRHVELIYERYKFRRTGPLGTV